MCTTCSGRATTTYQGSIHLSNTSNTIKRDENPSRRDTRRRGGCEREKQCFNTRTLRPPSRGMDVVFPLRPSPIFFFPSIVSSRGGRKGGKGKREAIPGDGLDGKTKHPGGCLRAAPVIRLAGGEAWSLAPVGVGSPGAGHRKSAGVATPYRESRTRSV